MCWGYTWQALKQALGEVNFLNYWHREWKMEKLRERRNSLFGTCQEVIYPNSSSISWAKTRVQMEARETCPTCVSFERFNGGSALLLLHTSSCWRSQEWSLESPFTTELALSITHWIEVCSSLFLLQFSTLNVCHHFLCWWKSDVWLLACDLRRVFSGLSCIQRKQQSRGIVCAQVSVVKFSISRKLPVEAPPPKKKTSIRAGVRQIANIFPE